MCKLCPHLVLLEIATSFSLGQCKKVHLYCDISHRKYCTCILACALGKTTESIVNHAKGVTEHKIVKKVGTQIVACVQGTQGWKTIIVVFCGTSRQQCDWNSA